MCNNLLSALCIILMVAVTGSGCKSDPPLPPPEEDLRISVDAPSYSTTPAADFSFNLKIESAMPVSGVQVENYVISEIDNQSYLQAPAINTRALSIPISIGNLPRQKICICTVVVTSKTKSTNRAIQTFRIVYK